MLRRKLALALLLVLPTAALSLRAQSIVGQWQGTLQSPHPLRVVLNVWRDTTGSLQAYDVSIDQSPDHIPVTTISMTHEELDFSIAMIQGSYHGKISADGNRIDGTWTQGSPMPLNFERATEATSWLTKSKTRLVAVAPGMSLEVIDWGGSGPPIVFLAGLGNTAHIFDNFAPKFLPNYHVYGITRRGFGVSSSPVPSGSNYSADQLGDDVLKVMDVLGINKPVIIGHSIAGEELSSIGNRFPDKVAGLVYLDAGYAYALWSPDSGDSRLDAEDLQKDLSAFLSAPPGSDDKEIVAKSLAALAQLQKDFVDQQKEMETLPPPPANQPKPPFAAAGAAIIMGQQKYTSIPVPFLAIFASPHNRGPMPNFTDAQKAALVASDKKTTSAQIAAFQALKSAKVVILPNASHYVFLSNEPEVEKDIKDFLATVDAAGR
ncbi:MAG: alpha/beta hydrolase [Terracidiphilus sp.]|jgi:pimeloyl-ACP methyl ester carboxylesterase